MQKDAVLRIPLCTTGEIDACTSALSEHKQYRVDDHDHIVEVNKKVCESAVPGACPRITCKGQACRLLGLIQTQVNESGFWMKLPCGECPETRELSKTTEGFVYDG